MPKPEKKSTKKSSKPEGGVSKKEASKAKKEQAKSEKKLKQAAKEAAAKAEAERLAKEAAAKAEAERLAKEAAEKAAKKASSDDSSDDSSSDDSSSDDSSSDDSSSDDSASSDKQMKDGSSDSSDDDSSSESQGTKRKASEPVATPPAKKAKTEAAPVTPVKTTDGAISTKLMSKGLSFKITDEAFKEFLADCGEVTSIRWHERDGRFSGMGFFEMESSEAAAKVLAKNGQDLMGRPFYADIANDRPSTPRGNQQGGNQRGNQQGGNQRGQQQGGRPPREGDDRTAFVGCLADNTTEENLREFFGDCGEIINVRFLERDGQFKGCGWLRFAEVSEFNKALKKDGATFLGRKLRVGK